MRLAAPFLVVALLAPKCALACGDQPSYDTSLAPGWPVPTVAEVDAAIDAAAAEFGVPVSILQAVAHTESRWQHHPYRVTSEGRRGIFSLSPDRQEIAADVLGISLEQVRVDVVAHARSFAALLDMERPAQASAWQVGPWRPAIAWALELPDSFADQYVDGVFALIADGLVDRLPTGEPVVVVPAPLEASDLGVFSPSTERSSDYGPATWNPTTCNYQNASRTPGDVDVVIIHTVQGSYSGCISWFHNCSAQVSAHYVVSTTGAITQIVAEEDVAWHVSCWNSFTIGIEHEGWVDEPEIWYTDAMYAASAALTADILADWGLPADRDHVMGHVEIDPACNGNGHTDPGTGWDWDYYMALVGGSVTPDPTELVGYVRHTDLYEPTYGIAGATVTVDGGVGSTTADGTGFYEYADIPAGDYTICADAPGFQQGCRTKTVEEGITNWGSLVLDFDPADDDDAGDDDAGDDDAGDDDAGDDDAGDDDAGDDDSAASDDDAEDAAVGGLRQNSLSQRRGCRSALAPLDSAGALAGLLFLVGGAVLLRRHAGQVRR